MQCNPSLLMNKCFVRRSSHGLKCQFLSWIWKFLVLFKRSQVVPSFQVSSSPSLIISLSVIFETLPSDPSCCFIEAFSGEGRIPKALMVRDPPVREVVGIGEGQCGFQLPLEPHSGGSSPLQLGAVLAARGGKAGLQEELPGVPRLVPASLKLPTPSHVS